jgi:hypothetical protein
VPPEFHEPSGTVPSFDKNVDSETQPNHFVEFYADAELLAESVATFMAIGLAGGSPAVVIARPAHRKAIEARLNRSVDLRVARERKQYVSLDAEETLDHFMRDGMPDRVEFEKTLLSVVESLSGTSERRFFGEMVAVLWAEGNVNGALALEDLWNGFLAKYPARLFCAYPADVLDENQNDVAGVHHRHSHIVISSAEATR